MLRDLQQSQARLVLAPHWQEHSRVHIAQEEHLELSLVYERASNTQWVDIHIHIHIHIHAGLFLAPHKQEHSRVHTAQEGHLELSLVYERASHIEWVHIHIHIHDVVMQIHDVLRRTNTTLDVLVDSRIDEYWNVDGERELSWPWCGFTQSTILNEKPPNGYTWFGQRLTKVQATSRPDYIWLEVLSNMSKRSHKKKSGSGKLLKNRSSTVLDN